MSKLDVIYAYHHGTFQKSWVGTFTYVIPLATSNDCIIICMNVVLPIGWLDSPKFFCAFSETLMDMVNALVHTSLPELGHWAITKISETGPGPPHNLDSLTHIYSYMYDMITVVKVWPER